MKNNGHKHFPIRIQGWIRVELTARPMVKWVILLTMMKCTASFDVSIQADIYIVERWCPAPTAVVCRCRYQSGQALFSPLKFRSEGLVLASAAQSADADFNSHLPRRRDSSRPTHANACGQRTMGSAVSRIRQSSTPAQPIPSSVATPPRPRWLSPAAAQRLTQKDYLISKLYGYCLKGTIGILITAINGSIVR